MKQLHQRIETQKQAINDRKQAISKEYKVIKNKLGSASSLSLTTLGFFVAGFLLLPRKMRLLRLAFKTFTVVTTARQFLDILPSSEHVEPKRSLETSRRRTRG
jgi:hypothetical protein